jgi:hypothetical protein
MLRTKADATAATIRVWFDCTPPIETSVSALLAITSGTILFELAQLVAAVSETGVAVLPLGENLYVPARMRRQAEQFFDRGRSEGQL